MPIPEAFTPLTGRCSCSGTTYAILAPPLITHCCHCTYCARETGSAFALNVLIETTNLEISSTATATATATASSPITPPDTSSLSASSHPAVTSSPSPSSNGLTLTRIPSTSTLGQTIARCPTCHTVLYSHYAGAGPAIAFVRAGTLDDASRDRVRPDVHIYTRTKAPWVDLSLEKDRGVGIFEEYYNVQTAWSGESLERLRKAKEAQVGMEERNEREKRMEQCAEGSDR